MARGGAHSCGNGGSQVMGLAVEGLSAGHISSEWGCLGLGLFRQAQVTVRGLGLPGQALSLPVTSSLWQMCCIIISNVLVGNG